MQGTGGTLTCADTTGPSTTHKDPTREMRDRDFASRNSAALDLLRRTDSSISVQWQGPRLSGRATPARRRRVGRWVLDLPIPLPKLAGAKNQETQRRRR